MTVDRRLQPQESLWKFAIAWSSPFSKFADLSDRIAFVIDMDRDMVLAELRKLLPAELVVDVEVGGVSWEA